MRAKQFFALRVLSFLTILWLMVGIETSLWPRFIPFLSPPIVWISFILFMSFYGEKLEGLVLCYLSAFVLHGFTSMSWSFLLLIILSLYYIGRFLRVRFFWSGVGYFTLMNAVFVLLLYAAQLSISVIFDQNPTSSIEFEKMIGQAILTPLFGRFMFRLLDGVYKSLAPDSTYTTGVAR